MSSRPVLIDVHTHVYTPAYCDLMRARDATNQIPLIRKDSDGQEKVILLKEEAEKGGSNSAGRPIGPQYWDRKEKIKFMDTHGIDVSVSKNLDLDLAVRVWC